MAMMVFCHCDETASDYNRIDVVEIRFFLSFFSSLLLSSLFETLSFLLSSFSLCFFLRFFTSSMFRPARRDYVVKTLLLLSRSLVLCFFDFGNSCVFFLPSYSLSCFLGSEAFFSLSFYFFPSLFLALSPILELCRPLLEGLFVPVFLYLSLMAT